MVEADDHVNHVLVDPASRSAGRGRAAPLALILKRTGTQGMPPSVDELYRQQFVMLRHCRPRIGTDTLFDMIAIRKMRSLHSRETWRAPW